MLKMDRRRADEKRIAELAEIAGIRLTDEEKSVFAEEMEQMLRALEDLEDPCNDQDWKTGAIPEEKLRADVEGSCLTREELLSAAPERDETCFIVPRVLEGSGQGA